MIIGKRAFARTAFPLDVALVLVGYVLRHPCVHGTSGFRSSFRLSQWTRCPASALQLRRFTRTGELVEKVAKLHFPALGGHSAAVL